MKNIVIVCLGTSKIIGDSIGPRIGQRLKDNKSPFFVYGTTERQINALNYMDYYRYISKQHRDDIIIVVDATLGDVDSIGKVVISSSGIKPGGAFDDKRKRIGDIGIMAVVGDCKGDRLANLHNVQAQILDNLENKIVNLICDISQNLG